MEKGDFKNRKTDNGERKQCDQAKIFGRQSYTLGENKKAIDKPIRPLDIFDFIKKGVASVDT